ncbi:MAG: histone [Candidatus Hydrothermarchaeales archaeon]
MAKIALAQMDRIIREATGLRVSETGKEALAEVLEDIAVDIAENAKKLATHAGRKTIRRDDIELAVKNVL